MPGMAAATASGFDFRDVRHGLHPRPRGFHFSDGRNFDDWRASPGRLPDGLGERTPATPSRCRAMCMTAKRPASAFKRDQLYAALLADLWTPMRSSPAETSWAAGTRDGGRRFNEIQVQAVLGPHRSARRRTSRRSAEHLRLRLPPAGLGLDRCRQQVDLGTGRARRAWATTLRCRLQA